MKKKNQIYEFLRHDTCKFQFEMLIVMPNFSVNLGIVLFEDYKCCHFAKSSFRKIKVIFIVFPHR